jgi:hypothetical protein
VDAGYVYAAGGLLCCDTKNRASLELDFGSFTGHLAAQGLTASGLEHLRTYWYDAATDGIPTPSQLAVGRLSGVKLRLGRLNNHQQKGVDSLIVRDLMKLANERAMATAFVLSGDEDLRQGVVEAQDCGVRVVLIGIEPCAANQAESLVREADDLVVINHAEMSSFIRLIERGPSPGTAAGSRDARKIGREVGQRWRSLADPAEVAALRDRRAADPRSPVPREIDAELLRDARLVFGDVVPDDDRWELRRGFWDAATAD